MTNPEDHLALVRTIAGYLARRTPFDVEFDDLFIEGAIALVEAAPRFEPERGFEFRTFVTRRILGAMQDYLRTLGLAELRGREGPRESADWLHGRPPGGDLRYALRWPFDVRESLRDEVARLPETDRKILELYYAIGLTFREIAQALTISESQIALRHDRAILKLRYELRRFAGYGGADDADSRR